MHETDDEAVQRGPDGGMWAYHRVYGSVVSHCYWVQVSPPPGPDVTPTPILDPHPELEEGTPLEIEFEEGVIYLDEADAYFRWVDPEKKAAD